MKESLEQKSGWNPRRTNYHGNATARPSRPYRTQRFQPQRERRAIQTIEMDRSNIVDRKAPNYTTRVTTGRAEGPVGIAGVVRIYQGGRLIARGEIASKKEFRDKKTGRAVCIGQVTMEVRKYA